jgi:hypothetical protein
MTKRSERRQLDHGNCICFEIDVGFCRLEFAR